MSVDLDPPELFFKRPFQHEVSQTLRLTNSHADPVAFKVKTTAPKQYCVRPNSGRIEPGKHVEVQILLQAMKEDPPPDAKCRDKFLVQSVLVTPDKDYPNAAALWSNIEQTSKTSIHEKKIRVVFLPADHDTSASPQTNGVSHRHDQSLLSSPSPEATTPQRGYSELPVGPVSRLESRPADSKSLNEARESVYSPAASSLRSSIATTAAGIAKAIPTSQDEMQAQLADAKATIARLMQQAESSTGLRQRTVESARDSKEQLRTATSIQQAPAGGVSVQLTAMLCLLSFLIAYFLF